MAIYVGENNALLLKNDKTVVEFYKGDKKLFGYNNSKYGEIITADNVHPIEHKLKVKLSSDTITDFSGVTVTRCGKNLFDNQTKNSHWELKFVNGSNTGEIIANNSTFTSDYIRIMPSVKLTGNYIKNWAFYNDNKTFVNGSESKSSSVTRTLTVPNNAYYIRFSCQIEKNNGSGVQLEFGTTSTEYEKYKEQTAMANANGTVDGLNSLSPSMTVLSDNNNTMIHISYC